ncbi:MAG: hypothetical protein QM809_04015 [Gordonia sp. (in: high G+C Gram-positive bacteria)]|uniref:hypothetical protein n=1 Tax=Gordonia sp. (in: high G+C Gram-positive bacteria) TaxID=84139 RepID=UPI0039E591C9
MIESLTYEADGDEATCSFPASFTSSTVTPTGSGACQSLSFQVSDLQVATALAKAAADPNRVWKVSAGAAGEIAVLSATWQTPAATETPSSVETTTTTEEATTTTESSTTTTEESSTPSSTPETPSTPSVAETTTPTVTPSQ